MSDEPRTPGTTTIAPGVLMTIARLTTLSVPGVHHLSTVPGGVNRLFKRNIAEGVFIKVEDGLVNVDLHVVLHPDTDVRLVSRTIQAEVSRAITEMVGMAVGRINVHIEDIGYPTQE